MLIPSKMNNLMSKHFYDKTITFYERGNDISAEGGRLKGGKSELHSIECNPQPTSQSLLKERYGLDLNADLMVTCSNEELIKKGFLFDYENITYEVIETFPFDSHWRILCQSRT